MRWDETRRDEMRQDLNDPCIYTALLQQEKKIYRQTLDGDGKKLEIRIWITVE